MNRTLKRIVDIAEELFTQLFIIILIICILDMYHISTTYRHDKVEIKVYKLNNSIDVLQGNLYGNYDVTFINNTRKITPRYCDDNNTFFPVKYYFGCK